MQTLVFLSAAVFFLSGCLGDTKETEPSAQNNAPENPETGLMQGMTEEHNKVRRPYNVPDLTWDEDLVDISLDWLNVLNDDGCQMEHNWDSPYGENLFWTSMTSNNREVVQAWASEVDFYDYDSNSCEPGEMCGHFTQIVWSTTERVGCASLTCDNGRGELWMCNYDPAGNWVGERPW